ncbi:MAG: flagellar hook-associated protein FlgL [Chthoniobacteraceae bacterium]|nr:flagellar hook-associated protein FlgL [Chthoniobacteraceae bacterium]
MRVTSSAFSEALTLQLQRLGQRQAQLQNQVSTGLRITDLSDDPAAMGRVLNLQAEVKQIQQYARNNAAATSVSSVTYSAVSELKKISDRAGELCALGGGLTSGDSRQAYAAETDQMIEQALQIGNSQYNGNYLFAGTKTDTQPFVSDPPDASGENITSVSYQGGASALPFDIGEGASVSPYTDEATNKQFADFINNLVSLRDALTSGDNTALTQVNTRLQTSEDNLLSTISGIGAVQTRLESNDTQNQARFASLQSLTSQETDVDLAPTVVKLTQTQTAYQAALQSGAQILQTSLLDYLK